MPLTMIKRWYRNLAAIYSPVMINPVLQHLKPNRLETFVDCTLGNGAHAFEIIRTHPELRQAVGLDLDPDAVLLARPKLEAAAAGNAHLRLHFASVNFKCLKLQLNQIDPGLLQRGVDGILMVLGLSAMQLSFFQLNTPERGFSHTMDGPLDMRFDRRSRMTAEIILNSWNERELGRLLRDYGEEQHWQELSHSIAETRLKKGPFKTTLQLVNFIDRRKQNLGSKPPRFEDEHPALPTFQALRIAVNDEINTLKIAIPQAASCLAPGGSLIVITSYGLEDRIVSGEFQRLDKRVLESEFQIAHVRPIEDLSQQISSQRSQMRVLQRLWKRT
ncbi:uncharacterized protein LOC112345787 isoform X1 [Selaginella moellendorffii]|uniref:uncharacterized protein LOC112345787 isoform X1 n=2 Tax=Selaginella moellendorffii TaxID=88036 RepID=UPI000D1C97A4|nr:uncharacterized protein LOC112345787 isoform X1 [Selaginella moellendorffii]|eukprot:XP_024528970.1 uncharacterized protein LOC112345787 isoform X1 [Selaginella moellendorffii]